MSEARTVRISMSEDCFEDIELYRPQPYENGFPCKYYGEEVTLAEVRPFLSLQDFHALWKEKKNIYFCPRDLAYPHLKTVLKKAIEAKKASS